MRKFDRKIWKQKPKWDGITQKFSSSARQSSEEFQTWTFLSTRERVQFERAPTRNRIGAQVDHIIYSRRCYYETMIIDAARMSFWLFTAN